PRPGLLLVAMMILATLADDFVPVYTGRIVDALVGQQAGDGQAYREALFYLALFMALGVAHHTLRSGSQALWAIYASQNMYEILGDALRRVQRFSADWHANSFAGGTVRKITRGMWSFDV